jgi:hypothetical protein
MGGLRGSWKYEWCSEGSLVHMQEYGYFIHELSDLHR